MRRHDRRLALLGHSPAPVRDTADAAVHAGHVDATVEASAQPTRLGNRDKAHAAPGWALTPDAEELALRIRLPGRGRRNAFKPLMPERRLERQGCLPRSTGGASDNQAAPSLSPQTGETGNRKSEDACVAEQKARGVLTPAMRPPAPSCKKLPFSVTLESG